MPQPHSEIDISSVWSFGTAECPPFDFPALFGNDHPVELDVGCGKGLFVYRESIRRPDVNYLAVEWSQKYSIFAAERLVKGGRPNVRVVSDDANRLVARIGDSMLQAVHIYFPDPWWKRKHRKRRIVNPIFLAQVERMLKVGGRLFLATDVEEYFGKMLKVMASPAGAHFEREHQHIEPPADPENPAHSVHPEGTRTSSPQMPPEKATQMAKSPYLQPEEYLSHFERKYRIEGRQIHYAHFRLTEKSDPAPPTASAE